MQLPIHTHFHANFSTDIRNIKNIVTPLPAIFHCSLSPTHHCNKSSRIVPSRPQRSAADNHGDTFPPSELYIPFIDEGYTTHVFTMAKEVCSFRNVTSLSLYNHQMFPAIVLFLIPTAHNLSFVHSIAVSHHSMMKCYFLSIYCASIPFRLAVFCAPYFTV